jgi:hypothetical protein
MIVRAVPAVLRVVVAELRRPVRDDVPEHLGSRSPFHRGRATFIDRFTSLPPGRGVALTFLFVLLAPGRLGRVLTGHVDPGRGLETFVGNRRRHLCEMLWPKIPVMPDDIQEDRLRDDERDRGIAEPAQRLLERGRISKTAHMDHRLAREAIRPVEVNETLMDRDPQPDLRLRSQPGVVLAQEPIDDGHQPSDNSPLVGTGCPWNKATHIARNEEYELRLCECCALAHDEADGWTVTQLHHQHDTR